MTTATATQLKPKAPPVFPSRLPEREKLREAIARKAAAVKRQADIAAALERSNSGNLFAAIKAAKVAVEDAQASEGRFLTAVALNEISAADSPLKAARERLAQLESDYSQARRTQAALETAVETVQMELSMAQFDLDAALRNAVQSDVAAEQLIERYRQAQTAYFDMCATLSALSRAGVSVLSQYGAGYNPQYQQRHHAESESTLRWIAGIEKLRTDADAELPTS